MDILAGIFILIFLLFGDRIFIGATRPDASRKTKDSTPKDPPKNGQA